MTWPQAIFGCVVVAAMAWVIVSMLKMLSKGWGK